jgi:hypothetical protein
VLLRPTLKSEVPLIYSLTGLGVGVVLNLGIGRVRPIAWGAPFSPRGQLAGRYLFAVNGETGGVSNAIL